MPAPTTSSATQVADKVPFWVHFRAWWDGYDVGARSGASKKKRADHEVRYEEPKPHWETARLRLAQEVWGEGFSSPGGTEYILNMVKFFALNPAMSVLDLGAGLGGATRAMSSEFGVWVTGLEAEKELAEAGMALSTKAGMGKKAAIAHFDPTKFEYKAKSIDCVFSKEFLFTIEDKQAFLATIEATMKPRGQLLFTDYVLARRGQTSKVLTKWLEFEPLRPHAWAVEDYKEALTTLHLDIRVIEDLTDQFQSLVARAWASYIKTLETRGVAPEDSAALVGEVELWARRMRAVEAGDLKICRVHALKKDTNRLMSSW